MSLVNDMKNFYKLIYIAKDGKKHAKTFKDATKSCTALMHDANHFLKDHGYKAVSGSTGRRIFK